MPLPLHRQKHLALLLFSYPFFTLVSGSGCLFIYFLITGQTPSIWLVIIIYNVLWLVAFVSGLKASYLTGLTDNTKTPQLHNKPQQ